MRKFIFRILLIIAISALLILGYCHLASVASFKTNGPNTEEQIKMSFDNALKDKYNCYFLGNSRIYRDINPDLFTSVKSYNLGHDNDSYNQMYYKLKFLLDNDAHIEYLIIGTDYFQFSFLADTRNYVYSSIFPKDYSDDFGNKTWLDNKEDYYTRIWTNKQNALKLCINLIINRYGTNTVPYQRTNGQYIVHGSAKPKDFVNRDYDILDVQWDYFLKIISLCEEKNIKLYVVMPPLWEGETSSHTDDERARFDSKIREALSKTPYKNNYINYYGEKGLSSYKDFIDVTHLKPEAADEFSKYINERIFGM